MFLLWSLYYEKNTLRKICAVYTKENTLRKIKPKIVAATLKIIVATIVAVFSEGQRPISTTITTTYLIIYIYRQQWQQSPQTKDR